MGNMSVCETIVMDTVGRMWQVVVTSSLSIRERTTRSVGLVYLAGVAILDVCVYDGERPADFKVLVVDFIRVCIESIDF